MGMFKDASAVSGDTQARYATRAAENAVALQVETNRLLYALLVATGQAANHPEVGPAANPGAYELPGGSMAGGQKKVKTR